MTYHASVNEMIEAAFRSSGTYADPYNDVDLDVIFSCDAGVSIRVPAFWAGDNVWKVRFAAPDEGTWNYVTECSNGDDTGLAGQEGVIEAGAYRGNNQLLKRGRLRVAENRRHLETTDGQPFFWLGDTWWMGLSTRLNWPQGFKDLTADRVAKGYNVVQIIAGPYPDMDAWDERGKNEAGYPFAEGFERINPEYYDHADLKIGHLVQNGIAPCIVGMWGYYLPVIGVEKIKRYWRYIVARYGAYPVTWCIAGEATMADYLSENREEEAAIQKTGWTDVARYVREVDEFDNPITIHPTQYGREQVEDPSVLDFEMLQTGHGGYDSIVNTVESVLTGHKTEPTMPTFVSEVCYEGILGRSDQNVQRMCFWMSVLSGAMGFTYGANGIWQMSTKERPYGPSPHGRCWGNTPWQEASQLPGSRQVGLGRALLENLPWHEFELHNEWTTEPWDGENHDRCIAAGIPGKVRVIYKPSCWNPPTVTKLDDGSSYTAYYYDPVTGEEIPIGAVEADDDGTWTPPFPPEVHDWVLVLQANQ